METVVPLLLLVLLAVVLVLLRIRPAARGRALERFGRKVGLVLPDGHRGRVERLLLVRDIATDLGAIVAVAIAWTWVTVGVLEVPEGWVPAIMIATALVGAAVGAGATAVREATRSPRGDGRLVARASSPRVEDYVAPFELVGGRVTAILPTVLVLAGTVAAATTSAPGTVTTWSVVFAAVAALGLVASEVAGRRLVAAPQVAASEQELALHDALRARVLRDLVTVPIVLGFYATFGILSVAVDDLGAWPATVSAAALGVVAMMGIALAGVSLLARPHRYFRQRLWPQLDEAEPTTPVGAR